MNCMVIRVLYKRFIHLFDDQIERRPISVSENTSMFSSIGSQTFGSNVKVKKIKYL